MQGANGAVARGRIALAALMTSINELDEARKEWTKAARNAEADRAAWAAHDLTSSRTRAQCVQELIDQGVAKTNAQTQASDHPKYKEHRDLGEKLAKAKEESELEKSLAYQTLDAAKLKVQAHLEIARAGGFGDEALLESLTMDAYNQGFDAGAKKFSLNDNEIDSLADIEKFLREAGAKSYSEDVCAMLAIYRPADQHEVRERDKQEMLQGKPDLRAEFAAATEKAGFITDPRD